MRKITPILIITVFLIPLVAYAATRTISSDGNWSDTGTWTGGNIPISTDDVEMNNGRSVTVQSSDDVTIVTITTANNNTITIDDGGTLTINNPGNTAFTAMNNEIFNVNGDLIINGDLVVNNNLTFNVGATGSVTITGDVIINNGASLDIAAGGSLSVDGDFTGGNNTNVNVDGTIDVTGAVDTGNGSDLTGSGTFTSGGGCTGEPDFCSGAPLPVELIYFEGITEENRILLEWSSATEENFNFYTVQKSKNGVEFEDLGDVEGQGGTEITYEYRYIDEVPVAGINYYRLKAIDLDGSFEYHDIIGVNYEGEVIKGFKMYPNPSNDGLITIKPFDRIENGIIEIFDNYGLVILKEEISSLAKKIQIPQSTTGTVIVRLRTKDSVATKRLILK